MSLIGVRFSRRKCRETHQDNMSPRHHALHVISLRYTGGELICGVYRIAVGFNHMAALPDVTVPT